MKVVAGMALALMTTSAHAEGITGSFKSSFISGAMPSCMAAFQKDVSGNEEVLKAIGITKSTAFGFCQCSLRKIADRLEPAEVKGMLTGEPPSESYLAKAAAAKQECFKLMTDSQQ